MNIIIQDARQRAESLSRADADRRGRQDDNPVYGQPNEAVDNMAAAHQTALRETESNRQRMGTFNITLFGRTMSGKSTLMEVLANGEGKSIGRGAQRTTQDVRERHWNGMKVTGVPGAAAFGGNVDEDAAYGAANQAGLILFLITSAAAIALDAGARIKSDLDQRKADNQCIQYRQNIRAECADIARQMENEVQAITEAYIREVLTEPMERMQEYADRMNDERRKQKDHMQRLSEVSWKARALTAEIHAGEQATG